MQIKGTGIETIPMFIREKFPDKYDEWLNSLSEESQKIMKRPITSSWYPAKEGLIEPTKKFCDMFYEGSTKGAWESGRFSADYALKGVYKLFVKLGSPSFLVNNAAKIFSVYYRSGEEKPCEIKVVESTSNMCRLRIYFTEPDPYLVSGVAGWLERALEINGCSKIKITITDTKVDGYPHIEFFLTWNS
jgi:hypothetical protein